jgi:hypothetical protein
MRRIAPLLLLLFAASGCKSLDVKAVTFNVNVTVALPIDRPK